MEKLEKLVLKTQSQFQPLQQQTTLCKNLESMLKKEHTHPYALCSSSM